MSNTFNPVPTVHFPTSTLADTACVDTCVNLRPAPEGGLAAVGVPAVVSTLPGATPVEGGGYTLPDGTFHLIVLHNGALKSISPLGVTTAIIPAASLTDTPSCILPVDNGIIVMFSSSAPRRFTCTPGDGVVAPVTWDETPLFPDLPPMTFTRSDMGRIGVDIPEFTLSSTYTTTSQTLTAEDQDKVDRAMRDAYIRLGDLALSRGWYIQPVVARYRLYGHNNEVIYTSAPVFIGPDSGLQGVTAKMSFTGQGFRRMELARLRATPFIPALVPTVQPDAVWRRIVRDYEVEITPQAHPYSAILPGSVIRESSSATELVMTATLPGVPVDKPYGIEGTRAYRLVSAALADPDKVFVPGFVMADSTETEIAIADKAIRNAERLAVTPGDFECAVSAPHIFTAATVSRSGDNIAWGGIRAIPFAGYSVLEMSVNTDSVTSGVPTAAVVTMRDGSTVVRAVTSASRRATFLSPLIVYPSPDAVSITLLSGSDAVTLPLTPAPGKRFSCYLAPDLQPVAFNEQREGFALPAASPRIRDFAAAVITTNAKAPLVPVATTVGDGSAIHSIRACRHRANSLSSPNPLFYTFTAAGISTVSRGVKPSELRLVTLDHHGVKSPRAVTAIPGGVAAIAGGNLLVITGSGSHPHTLLSDCKGEMLAWSDRFGELWCLPAHDADGGAESQEPLTVISPDGKTRYTREGIGVATVYSDGNRTRLFTPSGDILDPADETDGPVTVRHISEVTVSHRPNAEVWVSVGLTGAGLDGSLQLASHGGAVGDPGTVIHSHTDVSGHKQVSTAFKVRLKANPRLRLGLTASTSYPSTLRLRRL